MGLPPPLLTIQQPTDQPTNQQAYQRTANSELANGRSREWPRLPAHSP